MLILALPTTGAYLALLFVAIIIAFLLNRFKHQDRRNGKRAPGPTSFPVVGGIPFMARYENPTSAFSALSKIYGNVASIKLGAMECVVVSGYENFRSILCSSSFDARPDFTRINLMFGGNKNNSLAFTDYTDIHHRSRALISAFSLARNTSSNFETLDSIATANILQLVEQLRERAAAARNQSVPLKELLSKSVCKTFLAYFTSVDVCMDSPDLLKFVQDFDTIFEEVNGQCIGDIFPLLMNFISKDHVVAASHSIRHFVHKHCLEPKLAVSKRKHEQEEGELNDENENNSKVVKYYHATSQQPVDMLDALLVATERGDLTLDQALFALEDLLGGNSAVSHSIIRMLISIAARPHVQQRVREESRRVCSGPATMSSKLVYTEATVWECLRFISSQIVPHKATEDTEIDGWHIKKETVVLFNNWDLHFCPELWDRPEEFNPERFLTEEEEGGGETTPRLLKKPDHFIPFSTGRRSCLGQKLLVKLAVTHVANLCQAFELSLDPTEDYSVPRAVLAVGNKPYKFLFKPLV